MPDHPARAPSLDDRTGLAHETSPGRIEWLRERVKKSPVDVETLAILDAESRDQLTRAQLAARYGMTEDVLEGRVRTFRTKYDKEWKRERMLLLALLLVGLVILVAVVATISSGYSPKGLPGEGAPSSR